MKPTFLFSAALRIMDNPEANEVIASETDIQPTHSHIKGQLRFPSSSIDRRWDSDVWILSSPLPEEESLSAHLVWLWQRIFNHKEFFKKLVDNGATVDIFCGYRSDSDNAGFSIQPEALEIVKYLGVPLEISIVVHSMEDSDS